MKTKSFLILINFWLSFSSNSQSVPNRVTFDLEFPNQNQMVPFSYDPDTSIFQSAHSILCKIYFSGPIVLKEFPRVIEPKLLYENGLLHGSFTIPENATGIIAVFTDSTAQTIDTNSGLGYWSPVFIGNKLQPGSLSSIAKLLANSKEEKRHNKDYYKKLFEKDFDLHPNVKRGFISSYLVQLDIHSPADKTLYVKELLHFTRLNDLNEKELLEIKHHYSLLHQPDSAKKYNNLVLERYPNSPYAIQLNSLKSAMQIDTIKNQKEKWRRYHEYKEKYCSHFPDSFTSLWMQNRLGQLLQGMIISVAHNNDLIRWEMEVESLDSRPKYNTYYRTARFIAEQLHSNSLQLIPVSLKTESRLFQNETLNDQQLIKYGEKLANESVAWFRQYLDAPRGFQDELSYTDNEIRAKREEHLATVLDVWGQNLLLQKRFEEARDVLQEAVMLSRHNEAEINEHYIGTLIQCNQLSDALAEVTLAITFGKSTAAINTFYKSIGGDSSVKNAAVATTKAKLKKLMISEEMPDGSLLDFSGRLVSVKNLEGKTIVMDFWATWCMPCIIGMQATAGVVEKYKDQKDVVFLFVNTEKISEEMLKKVKKRLQETDYNIDVFFDPEINTSRAFKVNVLPTTVIIDSKGKIRFRQAGISIKKGKQELIDELTTMIELVR